MEKIPEPTNNEKEQLPEWVRIIRDIYESTPRKKLKPLRIELEILNKMREEKRITELKYWEEVREILSGLGLYDSWWGDTRK